MKPPEAADPARRDTRRHFHWAGSYDQSYPRHHVIQQGLRELGYRVTETRDQSFLVWRWIRMCFALFRVPRSIPLVVGEASNYLTPLIVFGRLQRRTVTFDPFVLLAEVHRNYHKGVLGFCWGLMGAFLDRLNCRLASSVIVDSHQQRDYFAERLGIAPSKFHVVNGGVQTDLFVVRDARTSLQRNTLNVLFFGSFIPLHGIETILGAASLLADASPKICFTLVGHGPEYERMAVLSRRLNLQNVTFEGSVPHETLPNWIAAADVCLGIFGDTPQAQRVIPNKVFQAAACGRPIITADTRGIREVFTPETAVLIPPADPKALADALVALSLDSARRLLLGARCAEVVREGFGPVRIAEQFISSQAST